MTRRFTVLWTVLLALVACTDTRPPPPSASIAIRGGRVRLEGTLIRFTATHNWTATLRTTAVGGISLGEARSIRHTDRVTLTHAGVDAWYREVPRGLQHGYTVRQRRDAPLDVILEVDGLIVRQLSSQHLGLLDDAGRLRMRYGELYAWDADHKPLSTTLTGSGHRIVLHVDDTDARYPIVIDPTMWVEQTSLVPSGSNATFYATAVALNDQMAFVTSPNEGTGAVHVFSRSNGIWTEQPRIVPDDLTSTMDFGSSVDVADDRMIVGDARFNNGASDTGAAWIFDYDGQNWTQTDRLTPATRAGDRAGDSVAISGDLAAVGAHNDDDQGTGAGAVYVYRRAGGTWALDTKLVAPDAAAGDNFGEAITLDGDILAIGAPARDGTDDNEGAVYVFRNESNSWVYGQTIVSSTPRPSGRFGDALDLDGDALLIGQPNTTQSDVGTAFVYTRSGDSFGAPVELPASSTVVDGAYATAVALHAGIAVVGAPRGIFGPISSTVWRKSVSSWSTEAFLSPSIPLDEMRFGSSVATHNGLVLIGAEGSVPFHNNDALIFTAVGDTCISDDECASGSCADGVCCLSACDGGCSRCDLAGNEGICTPLPSGDVGDCAPHRCNGTSLECPPCADNSGCIDDHYCESQICNPRKPLGDACTLGDQCLSMLCVDGFCCDDSCASQCLACDVAGAEGTCTPVFGEPHGERAPCRDNFCDANEHVAFRDFECRGGSACEPVDMGTPCKPYACGPSACRDRCLSDEHCIVEGESCYLPDNICRPTDPVCDGDSTLLLPDGSESSCLPFRCTATDQCFTACSTTAQCADGFVCDADGGCIERPRFGDPTVGCACTHAGASASNSPSSNCTWLAWLLLAAAFSRSGRSSDRARAAR